MALSSSLRQPSALEWPGAGRARQFWSRLRRARDDARKLPIAIRSDEPFEPQTQRAAAAERLVEQDADGITCWLHMPGAGRNNTEVVWDPERSKLSVGAWSHRLARDPGRSDPSRRLLWHASTWQPDADGARATAKLARSWVGVHLPRRAAA
jgi:hypothetical protein